jgi:ribosomal protein S28E/S33
MPGPLLAGDIVPAIAETSYTPVLSATTTSPTLGSGSGQNGRYFRNPITGLIWCQIRIAFGTSGVNPGSGTYRLELPTAVDTQSGSGVAGNADTIGHGIIRDSGTAANRRTVHVYVVSATGGTGGVGLVEMAILDGTNASVAHNVPFTWDVSDVLSLVVQYPDA